MSDFFEKWQCDIIERNSWNIAKSIYDNDENRLIVFYLH